MNVQAVAMVVLVALATVSGRATRQVMVRTNFVGEGSNDLAIQLMQTEFSSGENVVFSPLGYNAILAILAEGAQGETRRQIAKALNLPEDVMVVRGAYKTILSRMTEHGAYNQPEFKSWFYVYKNHSVDEAYKTVMKDHYLIDIKEVDHYESSDEKTYDGGVKFTIKAQDVPKQDSSEEEANKVSSEEIATEKISSENQTLASLEEATNELSNDTIPSGSNSNKIASEPTTRSTPLDEETTTEAVSDNQIDPKETESQPGDRPNLEDIIARSLKSEIRSEKETVSALSANRLSSLDEDSRPNSRMIIFNALYLRGNWSTPLRSKEEKVPFYGAEGERKVDAMTGEGELATGTIPELGASAVDLPYQGDRYSMLILLPDKRDGLGEFVQKLSGFSFKNIGQYLTKRPVNVCIPKFKFYTISKPKDALLKSGIKDIFGEEADLSAITGSKGLYLDDLVQLVTLDVDQSRSSFVQLTSSIVTETRSSAASFNVNSPFAFIVRDIIDNLVVVAGLVQNPSSSGK